MTVWLKELSAALLSWWLSRLMGAWSVHHSNACDLQEPWPSRVFGGVARPCERLQMGIWRIALWRLDRWESHDLKPCSLLNSYLCANVEPNTDMYESPASSTTTDLLSSAVSSSFVFAEAQCLWQKPLNYFCCINLGLESAWILVSNWSLDSFEILPESRLWNFDLTSAKLIRRARAGKSTNHA